MELSDFLTEWNNDGEYISAHTSGSTGLPKDIKLLKSDMRISARATIKFFGITSNSFLGIPLSMDYIAAKMMAVRAWEAGCNLKILPISNNICVNCNLDLLSVVPSQAQSLIDQPYLSDKISNIIIGGGPLDDTKEQRLIEIGYKAYASYGMTETCSHVALRPLGCKSYKAMPDINFEIDNRKCLIINCPLFSFNRIVTNDVVDLVNSREFIWRGRYDNVINSGGLKLHPEELERLYKPFIPGNFYLVGIADKKWGQALQLVVEDYGEKDLEIMYHLRDHIDHKYIPKSIIVIKSLFKGQNGKIKRISF